MLVRSQNKETVLAVIRMGIKESKKGASIYANFVSSALDCAVEVGDYQTKELAIKELDDMVKFFTENPSGIYQMK
jgi:hypothetical protein